MFTWYALQKGNTADLRHASRTEVMDDLEHSNWASYPYKDGRIFWIWSGVLSFAILSSDSMHYAPLAGLSAYINCQWHKYTRVQLLTQNSIISLCVLTLWLDYTSEEEKHRPPQKPPGSWHWISTSYRGPGGSICFSERFPPSPLRQSPPSDQWCLTQLWLKVKSSTQRGSCNLNMNPMAILHYNVSWTYF